MEDVSKQKPKSLALEPVSKIEYESKQRLEAFLAAFKALTPSEQNLVIAGITANGVFRALDFLNQFIEDSCRNQD